MGRDGERAFKCEGQNGTDRPDSARPVLRFLEARSFRPGTYRNRISGTSHAVQLGGLESEPTSLSLPTHKHILDSWVDGASWSFSAAGSAVSITFACTGSKTKY